MRQLLILFILSGFSLCFAQERQSEPPRLVVGIKIDGLQADHLILEALKEDISSEDVTTNSVMKEYVKSIAPSRSSRRSQ